MTTITSSSVKRSWASIVSGNETPATPPAGSEVPQDVPIAPEEPRVLHPAKRGERKCHCWGEVLMMLGHYGWIMPFNDIECSDKDKTAGRVYVHKRDVAKGASLVEGDVVSFFLYADDQGLGAEVVRLEKSMAAQHEPVAATSFRTAASEFVPGGSWNACASEFVPSTFSAEVPEFVPATMNVAAKEFVPPAMNFNAQEFVPAAPFPTFAPQNQSYCAFNLDLLSDSDDESDDEVDNDGDKDFNESDKESTSNESVQSFEQEKVKDWNSRVNDVVRSAPWKSRQVSSDGGSTGADSDSEAEGMSRFAALAVQLKFPPGVRPPPGLSLPELTA